jgi:hypothetical protein
MTQLQYHKLKVTAGRRAPREKCYCSKTVEDLPIPTDRTYSTDKSNITFIDVFIYTIL